MTAKQLTELLPGRTAQAIGNVRARQSHYQDSGLPDFPVKDPGDYVETLSSYLVDEFECLEIWLKWNGYATCRELTRDERGWVTLLCTAK